MVASFHPLLLCHQLKFPENNAFLCQSITWYQIPISISLDQFVVSLSLDSLMLLGWPIPEDYYQLQRLDHPLELKLFIQFEGMLPITITFDVKYLELDFAKPDGTGPFIVVPLAIGERVLEEAKVPVSSFLKVAVFIHYYKDTWKQPTLTNNLKLLAQKSFDLAIYYTSKDKSKAYFFDCLSTETLLFKELETQFFQDILKKYRESEINQDLLSVLKFALYLSKPSPVILDQIELVDIQNLFKFDNAKILHERVTMNMPILHRFNPDEIIKVWSSLPIQFLHPYVLESEKLNNPRFAMQLVEVLLKDAEKPNTKYVFTTVLEYLARRPNTIENEAVEILNIIVGFSEDRIAPFLRLLFIYIPSLLKNHDLKAWNILKLHFQLNDINTKVIPIVLLALYHGTIDQRSAHLLVSSINSQTDRKVLMSWLRAVEFALEVTCYTDSDPLNNALEILYYLINVCLEKLESKELAQKFTFFSANDYNLLFSLWIRHKDVELMKKSTILRHSRVFRQFSSYRCLAVALKYLPLEWFANWELSKDNKDFSLFQAIFQASILKRMNVSDGMFQVKSPLKIYPSCYISYLQAIAYLKENIPFWIYDPAVDIINGDEETVAEMAQRILEEWNIRNNIFKTGKNLLNNYK